VRTCSQCPQEAAYRKQLCYECWLSRQSPIAQQLAARRRLSLIPEQYRVARIAKKDWPAGRRWCAGCQTFMRTTDCTGSRCKACTQADRHRQGTVTKYGLDVDTYDWLFALQKGRCAICRHRPQSEHLAVDHEHGCPQCKGSGCERCVRGLLCSKCNHELLGAAHDSVNILRNAVAYLDTPPMRGEWDIPQWEREQWEAEHGVGTEPAPY
jgi:hypothetical protein